MHVIFAPENCDRLLSIKLPQPNDGKLKQYLYDEENLKIYEVTKYSDPFRSWFLDNQLSKEGHFNILTRVDPLFIFIPHLIKYVSTQFRTLFDVCSSYNNNCSDSSDKLDYALSPDIDWTLVCDTQDFDNELLVRFSETKTLDWLLKKHERTFEAVKLELVNQEPSIATLISHASDFLHNYIPVELSAKLKVLAKNKYIASSSISLSDSSTSTRKNKPPNVGETMIRPTQGTSSDQPPSTRKVSTEPASRGSILNYFKPNTRATG